MQVEVVTLGCLQIALFERFSMPGTIAFSDVHVVHVDGHPDVGGGISNLVVDMFVDEEIVSLGMAILDVVDARFAD